MNTCDEVDQDTGPTQGGRLNNRATSPTQANSATQLFTEQATRAKIAKYQSEPVTITQHNLSAYTNQQLSVVCFAVTYTVTHISYTVHMVVNCTTKKGK